LVLKNLFIFEFSFVFSLNSNHPDILKSGKKKVQVDCVDMVRILLKYDKNDFILVKMDIEGSEYEMLLHLYKNNVLDFIDQMAIENHPYINPFKSSMDVFDFIIKQSGIKVIKWV